MFDDLKLVARDEDEMEDFRDYDEDPGASPPSSMNMRMESLEDDDDDEAVAVRDGRSSGRHRGSRDYRRERSEEAPAAPARKPAKKARKASAATWPSQPLLR